MKKSFFTETAAPTARPINIPQFTPAVLRNKLAFENFLDNARYALDLLIKDTANDFMEMAAKAGVETSAIDYDSMMIMDLPSKGGGGAKVNIKDTTKQVRNTKITDQGLQKFSADRGDLLKFIQNWKQHNDYAELKIQSQPALMKQIQTEYVNLESARQLQAQLVGALSILNANPNMTGLNVTWAKGQIDEVKSAVGKAINKITGILSKAARLHCPKAVQKVKNGAPGHNGLDEMLIQLIDKIGRVDKNGNNRTVDASSYLTVDSSPTSATHGKLMYIDFYLFHAVSFVGDERIHPEVFFSMIFCEGVFYLKASKRRFTPRLDEMPGLHFVAGSDSTKIARVLAKVFEQAGLIPSAISDRYLRVKFNTVLQPKDTAQFSTLADQNVKVDMDKNGEFITFEINTESLDPERVLTEIHRLSAPMTAKFPTGVQWSLQKDHKPGANRATITLSLHNPPVTLIKPSDLSRLGVLGLDDEQIDAMCLLLNNQGASRSLVDVFRPSSKQASVKKQPDQRLNDAGKEMLRTYNEEQDAETFDNESKVESLVMQEFKDMTDLRAPAGMSLDKFKQSVLFNVLDTWRSNTAKYSNAAELYALFDSVLSESGA